MALNSFYFFNMSRFVFFVNSLL